MGNTFNISTNAKTTAFNDFMSKIGMQLANLMGITIDQLVVEETDIIMSVPLKSDEQSYTFEMFDKGKVQPFEARMSDKDIFLVVEEAAYILKTNEETGEFERIAFPYIDSIEFDGVKDGNKETDALQAFFGGRMTWKRGENVLRRGVFVRNLQQVPDRQLKDGYYPNFSQDGVPLTRKPILGGKEDIKITLDLGKVSKATRALIEGNIDAKGNERKGWQNNGLYKLRGFVVRGAAEAYSKMKV